MASAGEWAYAWAKACGIIGKSFIGPRVKQLQAVHRLSELDSLLFPDSPLQLPAQQLVFALERRISQRAADKIVAIVSCFSDPPRLALRFVSAFEYADMARCIAAAVAGEKDPPHPIEIGRFRSVRFEAYPDIAAMTAGTEFDWIADSLQRAGDQTLDIQVELSRRYYRALWADIRAEGKRGRIGFEEVAAEEITMKNIVWAMRVATYYRGDTEAVERVLVDVEREGRSLADEARKILEFGMDRREDWSKWKYSFLLNPVDSDGDWRLDPRYAQNTAARRLDRLTRVLFRRGSGAIDGLASFARLVRQEEDLLTSVVEGIALGVSPREVLA